MFSIMIPNSDFFKIFITLKNNLQLTRNSISKQCYTNWFFVGMLENIFTDKGMDPKNGGIF